MNEEQKKDEQALACLNVMTQPRATPNREDYVNVHYALEHVAKRLKELQDKEKELTE